MTAECAKCGSTKMMEGVQVFDQGQHSDGKLKVRVAEKPEAMLFKQNKLAVITANICGECGFTEFYVDQPREFYASYRKSQGSS